MTPWWSQAWVEHWGPLVFHGVLWPLTCLGSVAFWKPRWAAAGMVALQVGIALGVVLILSAALGRAQPEYVWGRLLLLGGLLVVIHGSMLAALISQRRGACRTGGRS